MTESSERSEWVVLGRVIGTATGWDQAETFFSIYVYELEPAPGLNIPRGNVAIDFEAGWIEAGDHKVDLIEALRGLPRA